MEKTIYKICLDLQQRETSLLLPIPQRDTARALQIRLTQGGIAYPLPEDAMAVLTAQGPSGDLYPWLPCELSQGSIFCPIPAGYTAEPGIVRCQLRLYADGDESALLTAPAFSLEITEQVSSATDEETISPIPNALDGLISRTLAAAQQADAVAAQLQADAQNGRFQGEKGDSPVRGVDYFTAEDVAYFKEYLLNFIANTAITESVFTDENVLCLPATARLPLRFVQVRGEDGPAQLQIWGKNFFDRQQVRSGLLGEGTALHISSAGFHYDLFTGTTGVSHPVPASMVEQLPVLPAGTYTISYRKNTASGYLRVEKVAPDGTVTLLNGAENPVFTLTEPSRITLRRSVNTAMTVEDVQIEPGTAATDYEDYQPVRTYTVTANTDAAVEQEIFANYPTTVLTAEPGYGLQALYWADTKRYIDRKHNAE